MTRPSKKADLLARFSDRYSAGGSAAALAVEREVIGANVGANGYTTVAQADMLVDALGITREGRLLDLGSGRGWPGLYIAEAVGCQVVLSDVPAAAVSAAERRTRHKNMAGRVAVVRSSGTSLPFSAGSFDAICHSDAL